MKSIGEGLLECYASVRKDKGHFPTPRGLGTCFEICCRIICSRIQKKSILSAQIKWGKGRTAEDTRIAILFFTRGKIQGGIVRSGSAPVPRKWRGVPVKLKVTQLQLPFNATAGHPLNAIASPVYSNCFLGPVQSS